MLTVVDSEAVVRSWARANSLIQSAVAQRVFFGTPQVYGQTKPANWLTLFLVSETHDPSDVGLQDALIQFDAWGRDKSLAASAAIALQQAGRQLMWVPPVTVGTAVIRIGSVSQRRWLPDPVLNLARYAVDLQFLISGAETN